MLCVALALACFLIGVGVGHVLAFLREIEGEREAEVMRKRYGKGEGR